MWREFRKWALLNPHHRLRAEVLPQRINGKLRWKAPAMFWGVLILLMLTSHSLSHLWVFQYVGLVSADRLDALRKPERPVRTVIVFVTEEERRALLGGVSPIPVGNLLAAVCAVLRAKPDVLGVDLDTAHVSPFPVPRSRTKIVWARGIRYTREFLASGREKIQINQDYLLGQSNPDVLSGLAVAPVMPDWSIRQIPACYEYDEGRVMPTMIAELARAAGKHMPECSGQGIETSFEVGAYRIHYQFDRFTLKDFGPQTLDKVALERCRKGEGEWADSAASTFRPLANRVVLLGGEYDPQDWHPTPYGQKPGVEVLASLTEHVLQGSAAFHIDDWFEWTTKLILALAIAWIHSRFRPLAALLLSLIGLATLVAAGGALAAYFSAYRASTVPFLLGIVLEQLVTSADKAQKRGNHEDFHSDPAVGEDSARATHR